MKDNNNDKPITGTVKEAWMDSSLDQSSRGSCTLHIKLKEYPNTKFKLDNLPIRVDQGERVRIWNSGSIRRNSGKPATGANAIQILDKNGNVKFSAGCSQFLRMGGYCSYSFDVADLKINNNLPKK
ncbi:hypothetical protein ACFL2R_02295 [Patescibacteria group bacterium]